jgi:hypothetical protein
MLKFFGKAKVAPYTAESDADKAKQQEELARKARQDEIFKHCREKAKKDADKLYDPYGSYAGNKKEMQRDMLNNILTGGGLPPLSEAPANSTGSGSSNKSIKKK